MTFKIISLTSTLMLSLHFLLTLPQVHSEDQGGDGWTPARWISVKQIVKVRDPWYYQWIVSDCSISGGV
jgi:hypothetical protein